VLTSVVVFVDYQPAISTSTVYATQFYTVLQCAPDVTNCPARSTPVVTATIPVSTTICPLTFTSTYVGQITTTTSLLSKDVPSTTTASVIPTGVSESVSLSSTSTIFRTLSSTITIQGGSSSFLFSVSGSQIQSSLVSVSGSSSSEAPSSASGRSLSFTEAFNSTSTTSQTSPLVTPSSTFASVRNFSTTAGQTSGVVSLSTSLLVGQTSGATNSSTTAFSASISSQPQSSESPSTSTGENMTTSALSSQSSASLSVSNTLPIFSLSFIPSSATLWSSEPLSTIERTLNSTFTVPGEVLSTPPPVQTILSSTLATLSCSTCSENTTLVSSVVPVTQPVLTSRTAIYRPCETCDVLTTVIPFTFNPGATLSQPTQIASSAASIPGTSGNATFPTVPIQTNPVLFTGEGTRSRTALLSTIMFLLTVPAIAFL